MESILCSNPSPSFFLLSEYVPSLIYYSHVPTAILSLFFAFFIMKGDRKSLLNRVLAITLLLLSLWSIADVVLWTENDSRIIMFVWSAIILLEALVFLGIFYFFLVFANSGKDISFLKKAILAALLLPIVGLLSTRYMLQNFDLALCQSIEGPIAVGYIYSIEILIVLWMLVYTVLKYRAYRESSQKKQLLFLTFGTLFFLLAFSWGNIFGSLTLDWDLSQHGLFGIPVFIGVLTYLIVKFNAFNIKLVGAQALMVALIMLIGSQFFFVKGTANFVLVTITFLLAIGFGLMLVRSVRLEVERKEELQAMADLLAAANEKLRKLDTAKSEFISIASHQLRTPLTAIKGYISLILEGSYGPVSGVVQDILNKVYLVNGRLTRLVEDLLSVSRIESGRIQYEFSEARIEPILSELVEMFQLAARKKGLTLQLESPSRPIPPLLLDVNKMKEVVSNLIDNAIKYTEKGSVTVSAEEREGTVRVMVTDTGIGIKPEDWGSLFNKFIRGRETSKLDVSGTGLGLFVGKNFVEAHHGRIWAESEGPGRGSTFIVELPLWVDVGTEKRKMAGE